MFYMIAQLIPVLAVTIIAIALFNGICQWVKNNNSPEVTVAALITGKRTRVTHHHTGQHHHHTSNFYYATFQLENGERIEMHISGKEYGMLAEGDRGLLTYQGTRYIGFER